MRDSLVNALLSDYGAVYRLIPSVTSLATCGTKHSLLARLAKVQLQCSINILQEIQGDIDIDWPQVQLLEEATEVKVATLSVQFLL